MDKIKTVYLSLTLLVFIWAFNNIGSKIISEHVAPFTAGAIRFGLASLVLLAYMWFTKAHFPRLKVRDGLMMLWLSAVGILFLNFVFFISFPFTTVSETFIIVGLNPVMTYIFAMIFIREKWYWMKFAGVVAAFTGVVIAFYNPGVIHASHLWGNFLFFLSVIAWVIYTISMKGILTRVSPIIVTTYTAVLGTLMLGIMALIYEKPLTDVPNLLSLPDISHLVAAFLYVGVVATAVAYIIWTEAVSNVGPSNAAIFIALVPPLGVFFSSLILHETPYPNLLTGLAFVIAGVILTTRNYRSGADKV